MRHEARVLEGDQTTTVLVPLSTATAPFKGEEGRTYNDCISERQNPMLWQPWVVWHAMTARNGEARPYEEWINAVDWCGLYEAPDALDPSGGEVDGSTQPSSPASSSEETAGPSSSDSAKTSKARSGPSSTTKEAA